MEYQKELEALLKALQRMQSRIDYDEEVLCDDCMERKVGGRWEEGGRKVGRCGRWAVRGIWEISCAKPSPT
jgi:hypothetical protein